MRQSSFISGFGMLKGVNNFINSPVEHKCSKAFTWSSRRVETPNKSSSCTTIFDHQICLMQLMFYHCVYSLSRNIVWNPLDSQSASIFHISTAEQYFHCFINLLAKKP